MIFKDAAVTRLVSLTAVTMLVACATTESTTTAERPSDKEYRTGSRIPVRPGGPTVSDVRTIGRDEIERTGAPGVNTGTAPQGAGMPGR